MGSVDNIGKALKDLWKEIEEFIKKRAVMLGILGSITGIGGWQISTLWQHVHNIEQLDERFQQMDSVIVIIDGIHSSFVKDSVEYHKYMKPMQAFLDTLPSLILEARNTKEAFESVQTTLKRLDSTQTVIQTDQNWIKNIVTGETRSVRASF